MKTTCYTLFILVTMVLVSCLSPSEVQYNNTEVNGHRTTTVIIGNQEWFAENLITETFTNGDKILHAKTAKEWQQAGETATPAWCYYNNDPVNGKKYGKLYNWHAVSDPRGLAPDGWRVPNDEDWDYLVNKIGNKNNAGHRMKSTSGWTDNGNGDNSSGFNVLAAGGRYNDGTFSSKGSSAFFWSSSDHLMFYGRYHAIFHNKKAIERNSLDKNYGFSVRCLRDLNEK